MDDALYRLFYEHEEAHWWFRARREIVLAALEQHGNLSAGDTVLDIGCGTGANAKALAEKYRVVAMDTSPLAVAYAKKRGLTDVLLGTLDTFPRDQFDVHAALLLDVIEHIDDDVAVLAQAREIVGPGGRVVVTVPAYMWLWGGHDVVTHHKRRYDQGSLTRAFAAAGLEPVKLTYFNTFLFPLIAAARLASRGVAGLRAGGRQARASSSTDADIARTATAPPKPVNELLRRVFSAEKSIVASSTFPFGVSLLAVARPL